MLLRFRFAKANSSYFCNNFIRTFLSAEFKCQESWNNRLNSDIIQKVNLDNMYYQIKQSIQKEGKPSAIDVDIFVNKITPSDLNLVDEVVDLINQLRLSEEASNTLDSTHHATVRNLTDMDLTEQLLNILDNRLDFGIFLDTYSAIYLLNHLILKEDFLAAAKVSTQLMLQEDLENKLVQSLSLYSCYKCLSKMPFTTTATEEPVQDEEAEVKKVRVKFLRNEYFDGHFDEKNIYRLLGKTFLALSQVLNKPFVSNCKLIGLTFCEKYSEAKVELQKPGNTFYKDVIEYCVNYLELIKSEDSLMESLKSKLQEQLENGSMNDAVVSLVKNVVKSQESAETQKQLEIYKSWNELREIKLKEEIERIQKAEKLKEIEKVIGDMKLEEQKLWFFENETQIDLDIDNKKLKISNESFGNKKKTSSVDDDYVPPEIIKQRPS